MVYVSNKDFHDFQDEFLSSQYFSSHEKLFRRVLVNHKHLLHGIQSLIRDCKTPTVHYDLKANNIMMDTLTKKPIIIDFGLSFFIERALATNSLDVRKMTKMFYLFYEKYPPWCFDIIMINYIFHVMTRSKKTPDDANRVISSTRIEQRDMDVLNGILYSFLANNTALHASPSYDHSVDSVNADDAEEIEVDKREFRDKWKRLLQHFIDQKKTWLDLFRCLVAQYPSWDNYALSVIMNKLVDSLHAKHKTKRCFVQYRAILKEVLFFVPEVLPPPSPPPPPPSDGAMTTTLSTFFSFSSSSSAQVQTSMRKDATDVLDMLSRHFDNLSRAQWIALTRKK